MNKRIVPIILLAVVALSQGCGGQAEYLERFKVEPQRYYKLTLEPEDGVGEGRWLIHQFTADGSLPFDGVYEFDWQCLQAGRSSYEHAFLTHSEAVEVGVALRNVKGDVRLKALKLAELDVPGLILNGDFSMGADNWSGWSQVNLCELVSDGAGGQSLLVRQNGYALSDYFPLAGGGGYTVPRGSKTWPGVSILVYDRERNLIEKSGYNAKATPPIKIAAEGAYGLILLNTSHDHIPAFTTNLMPEISLIMVEPGTAAASAAPPMSSHEEIILLPGSDPREIYAARELQRWIYAITGRQPALLAAPSGRKVTKLRIGAAQAAGCEDDLKWLAGSGGYAVRQRGADIHLFGATPGGTLNCVYGFLEANSDIIWPRPMPELEAIYTPLPRIEFKAVDFRSRPAFPARHISIASGVESRTWLARNRINNETPLHTGFDYLAWERGAVASYTSAHIGWASKGQPRDETVHPLIDGQRDFSRWRQPCYTNPETVKRIVAALREALELVPEKPVPYITSIIADNWGVCACPNCMAPITLPDGSQRAPKSPYATSDSQFFSTRNFMMLNQVAEALAPDYPGLRLITHAYIFTAEPPLVEVHPMIVPQFAAYPTQNIRFPINSGSGSKIGSYEVDVWQRRFAAWGKHFPHGLGYFGYYYTPGFNAVADSAAIDYRDLAAMGGYLAHTESFTKDEGEHNIWDADGVEKWIITRLMWDPSQDPVALRQSFIERVYREAAPEMAEFYALINKPWHAIPHEKLMLTCHSTIKDVYEGLIVNPGNEEQALALLEQAVKSVKHPLASEYVKRTQQQLKHYRSQSGRTEVPYVEESRHEWLDASSPHWEKALLVDDFKQVDDWRIFNEAAADPATEVRFMHDDERLYIRFMAYDAEPEKLVTAAAAEDAFPQGDRVELMVLINRFGEQLLAVGPNNNHLASPALQRAWESRTELVEGGWVALLALPLAEYEIDSEQRTIRLRVGRVYRHVGEERRESSHNGHSIFNIYDGFWLQMIMAPRKR